MPVLIGMCGLPRSGKSTISTALAKELGCPIVCKDSIRLALHGQRYQAAAEDHVRAIAKTMIKALFLRGHEVVIADETHFSKLAREHLKQDDLYQVKWYVVDTPKEVCIERAIATNQPDLVPIIEGMAARWEPLEPDDILYTPQVIS